MSKAQGQFTIIDYNDALTLTGYIGSNLAKTQMYNPDNGSYTPDWKTKNLVLTPCMSSAPPPTRSPPPMSPRSSGMWATATPPLPQVRTTD